MLRKACLFALPILGLSLASCSETGNPLDANNLDSREGLVAAAHTVVVDFEGFNAGDVVTGIGGMGVSVEDEGATCTDDAVIVDSSNPPGVGNDDEDLGTPNEGAPGGGPGVGADGGATNDTALGNLLIINEDPNLVDPNPDEDDCAAGGTLEFDFDGVAPSGAVRMESLTIVDHGDTEGDAIVRLYSLSDTQINGDFLVPGVADNGVTIYDFGGLPQDGVGRMELILEGSGATDNLVFLPADQGCTPGKWKNWSKYAPGNQPDIWPPTGYDPDQTVSSVFSEASGAFSTLGDASLHDALSFQGGDEPVEKAEILLRAAVAALLNAAHPAINYPVTEADVVAAVNAALVAGKGGNTSAMTTLAGILDYYNNLGCPNRNAFR